MLGRQQLVIDLSEFVKGMSSAPYISDGGFSPDTEAVNLITQPGVVYAPAIAVDTDTDDRLSTTIEIIASSPDMANLSVDNRLLIGANGTDDGTFYRYDGTKIIAAAYGTDTTRNYTKGYTDIIAYKGEAYVSSQTHLARWQNDNTITQDFFAFTNTRPHPGVVFEDNAFYGDGNLLLRQTAAAGTPATILTLPSSEVIIALGVDPGTGRMLISTTSSLNISNTQTSINKLHWYDGYSNKTIKTIYVGDMILGFHSVAGVTYCGYGQSLGYITGSGVRFLRKLLNVSLNNEHLPYKHNLTSIGSTLYVADGYKILAYGPIRQGGDNVFYYAARNKDNDLVFQSIFDAGSNKIGYSYIGVFKTVDTSSVATLNKLDFVTNWLNFPRPIIPVSVVYEFVGSISSTNNFTLQYSTSNRPGNYYSLDVQSPPLTSIHTFEAIGFAPGDTTSWLKKGMTSLQLRIQNSSENDGLRKIIVFYDYIE